MLAGRQFDKRYERQREKTSVIANEAHFDARSDVAKAGFLDDCARASVLGAPPLIGHEHKLKIHIVEHTDFEIHRGNLISFRLYIAILRTWRVIGEVCEVHFHLEVS